MELGSVIIFFGVIASCYGRGSSLQGRHSFGSSSNPRWKVCVMSWENVSTGEACHWVVCVSAAVPVPKRKVQGEQRWDFVNNWDHLYFVHPSTDISVDILMDSRLMYWPAYWPSVDWYVRQHIGRVSFISSIPAPCYPSSSLSSILSTVFCVFAW